MEWFVSSFVILLICFGPVILLAWLMWRVVAPRVARAQGRWFAEGWRSAQPPAGPPAPPQAIRVDDKTERADQALENLRGDDPPEGTIVP